MMNTEERIAHLTFFCLGYQIVLRCQHLQLQHWSKIKMKCINISMSYVTFYSLFQFLSFVSVITKIWVIEILCLILRIFYILFWTSLVAQMVKRLSTMRETRVQSLGWEESLEKEMAIHSSTIAWKIPWTEEPGRLQSMGSQRVRHDWATSRSYFIL